MFVLVNAAQLVIIFDWMIYAPVVPSLIRDLHLSYWEAGLPITALLAVMAAMQFIGGALADRFSEPLLSMIALAAAALSGVIAAMADSLPLLVLSRALGGVGSGLSFIAGMRMATRMYRGRQLTLAMGVFGAMVNLGILASSLAAPHLERLLGWRGVFLVAAGVSICLLLLYPLVDLQSLKRKHGVTPFGLAALTTDLKRFGHLVTWVVGLCHTASFGILLALSGWFPTLLTGPVEMGVEAVGLVMGLFAVAGVVGRISGGAVADLIGKRLHMALTLGLLGAVIAAIAKVAGPDHAWLTAGLVLAAGWLANHPFSPLLASAAARDPEHAGAVLGSVNLVAIGAAQVLPVGFGWLKDLTQSFQASLWFIAAVAWTGMVLSRYLPTPTPHAIAHPPAQSLTHHS